MKMAILYICTGKYKIFWKKFYLSCEKYFISNIKKEYFIFTDSDSLKFSDNKNVHIISQKDLGWPYNTLMRYQIFINSQKEWSNCDFTFFFNANLIFNKKINSEDFLPSNKQELTACLHPGFFNKKRKEFTYEKNPRSTAFIPEYKGQYYFAGGINGGITKNFIKVITVIGNNINKDEKNNIIAVWHDESHWNKYINEHINEIKIISPSYLYPEKWNIPFEKKIIIRNKNKYGGHNLLRGVDDVKKSLKKKIINQTKQLIKSIFLKGKKII